MEIHKLGDDRYQVIHDKRMDIMTLYEVLVLLSKPIEIPKDNFQMQMEEFWESIPVYPRM